jgi:hypothetical protein
MRTGEFVSGEAALVARAMLGALNWSVQWFRPDGPMTAEEIAEELADYLIRGLLAKPDARRFAAAGETTRIITTDFGRDAAPDCRPGRT